MTPFTRQREASRETVALARQQIESILYFEFGLNRDDADRFWNEALRASLDGDQ